MSTKALKNSLLYLFFILLLTGCDLIQMKEESQDSRAPIARAKDNFLYSEDLNGLVPEGIYGEDSLQRVERFIEDWGRKQLLISEASDKISFDNAEIERKVLDYRYSLMGYEYQQFYINQNLDQVISDEEILEYYNNNVDNFVLKQNIIRGKYIEVPREAPNTEG